MRCLLADSSLSILIVYVAYFITKSCGFFIHDIFFNFTQFWTQPGRRSSALCGNSICGQVHCKKSLKSFLIYQDKNWYFNKKGNKVVSKRKYFSLSAKINGQNIHQDQMLLVGGGVYVDRCVFFHIHFYSSRIFVIFQFYQYHPKNLETFFS